jgi:hypothetical protein
MQDIRRDKPNILAFKVKEGTREHKVTAEKLYFVVHFYALMSLVNMHLPR